MAEPVVELAGVARTYPGPPPVTALRRVDLSVHRGEVVAVVGPSGSGKSTLLHIMGLLDEPTRGRRVIAGTDTAALGERERTALRATAIGFVFQAFHLVAHLDSVRNVMVPLVHQGWPRRERRQRAVAALEAVGMGDRLHARPSTLSGGEQQRVAVARAIVHDPVLLLCDEPTGNLDRANTESILSLLRAVASDDRAVVVVSHDRRVEEWADRVVEVVDGVVEAAGGRTSA